MVAGERPFFFAHTPTISILKGIWEIITYPKAVSAKSHNNVEKAYKTNIDYMRMHSLIKI